MSPEPRPIVLCVDDDREQLASTSRVLRLERFEVLTTTSPRHALDILAQVEVAVLVSDFEMPEMSGVEVCAAARTVRPATVRIMLTGRGTFDTAVAGINEAEIFRFLTKPVPADRLRTAVRAAVARNADNLETTLLRDIAARRTRLLAELEHEHPGITARRTDDLGHYLVDPGARARVHGLGLDAVLALYDPVA